ncbi:MAG: Asp-tRNA(Asn)/Glu-tRNA(Gln) amidotransferase subunit GatA [bacterium]
MRSISEYLSAYQSGTNSESVISSLVDRIQADQTNAFITAFDGTSLVEQARTIDARRAAGERLGVLAGIPVAIKDNLCMRDTRTTAGSKILDNFVAPYDATVVRKLKEADAILVGKTNLDEFAMGSSNENSAYGAVKNPQDLGRVPGGSSGGSAAAVGANLCAVALGSDTGGSIRQPAAFSGIVGLKPTYGRVSRFGLIAFASSLDQIGPMTHTVEDAARVLDVIAGPCEHDMTSMDVPTADWISAVQQGVQGLRVGVPTEYFATAGLDPEIEAAVRSTIDALEAAGARIVEVSLPHTEYAVGTYYLIATAEASSNLARFDGVRYGHRAEATELAELYEKSRSEGFGPEVKRRIMLGTYVLSAGFYDAYYGKAQQVRTLIRQDFENAFASVDVIVGPTTPSPAFALGAKTSDPLQMYLEDIFTISCNLAGLPGISVPCGTTSEGLPIGFQIQGPAFREDLVFRVAGAVERL